MTTNLRHLSYFTFFALLLTTLILGESHIRFLLFGLWSMYFLFHWKIFDFTRIASMKWVSIGWSVYLSATLISFYFTHSIPLSLEFLGLSFTSLIIFWFFILIPKNFFPERIFFNGMLLLGLIMTCLSLFFHFYPEYAINLPGMNLIYATYGHNHISALLLLIIPISLESTMKSQRISYFLLYSCVSIVLLTALILSFGRVAILLGVVELILIFITYKNERISHADIKKYLLSLASFFIFFIAFIYIFFSVLPIIDKKFNCPWVFEKVKLCKSFKNEARIFYWFQAVEAIKQYPLVGYGPGTFSLISKRFQQIPDKYTGYAHNSFLQHFSEMGLIGGVSFLILISILLIKSWSVNQEVKTLTRKILLISVITSILNAVVDFDWSFSGVFFLTLIFLAILVSRSKENTFGFQDIYYKKIFFQTFLLLSTFSLIVISGINIFTEVLLLKNQEKIVITIFPYFFSQRFLIGNEELSLINSKKLEKIYYYHSDLLLSLYKKEGDTKGLKQHEYEHLFSVDPWSSIFTKLVYLDEDSQYQGNEEYMKKYIEFLLNAEYKYGYSLNRDQKAKLAARLLLYGDEQLIMENVNQGGESYILSYRMYEWSISDHPFLPSLRTLNMQHLQRFLSIMDFVPSEHFGYRSEDFSELYLDYVSTEWLTLSKAEKERFIGRVVSIAPWKEDEVKNLTFE